MGFLAGIYRDAQPRRGGPIALRRRFAPDGVSVEQPSPIPPPIEPSAQATEIRRTPEPARKATPPPRPSGTPPKRAEPRSPSEVGKRAEPRAGGGETPPVAPRASDRTTRPAPVVGATAEEPSAAAESTPDTPGTAAEDAPAAPAVSAEAPSETPDMASEQSAAKARPLAVRAAPDGGTGGDRGGPAAMTETPAAGGEPGVGAGGHPTGTVKAAASEGAKIRARQETGARGASGRSVPAARKALSTGAGSVSGGAAQITEARGQDAKPAAVGKGDAGPPAPTPRPVEQPALPVLPIAVSAVPPGQSATSGEGPAQVAATVPHQDRPTVHIGAIDVIVVAPEPRQPPAASSKAPTRGDNLASRRYLRSL